MLEAIAEKIDFSKSEQYTLSIRLSTDGFSFSIYNPILDNSLDYIPQVTVSTMSMTANVREMLTSDIFQYNYKYVNILQVSKRFTLIPFDLFNDEQCESVFYYNHSVQENEIVLENVLNKANVAIVFGMDKGAYQQLIDRFPSAKFYSQASPIIEHFAGKSRLGNCKKVYAYLRNESMDVFCYDKGKLLLANSFICKQTEDRIYYLLYLWKQLNYNQERDELHLVGTIEDKEYLTEELRKFVRQVFIINPKAEFNGSEQTKMEDIPFDLQVLSLREL